MSFRRLLDTQPLTIIRAATTTDRYGADALDWDNTTETDTTGWVNDTSRREVIDGRDALVSSWILYLDAGTEIGAYDRVRIGDVLYFVDGPPSQCQTPRGVHHVEARLLLIEG